MTPQRWKRVESIYHDALQLAAENRAAFLDAVCADDPSLRHEVESLISESKDGADFLERPAIEIQAESIARRQTAIAGIHENIPQLGSRYEILQEVGRGGMG